MAAFSLIPELDDIVKHGTAQKREDVIARIAELYLQGAAHFDARHVDLFDDILAGLMPTTGIGTRAELAERLSEIGNAPPMVVNALARASEIRVAGPILSRSALLGEPTLIEIARMQGQPHLAAIAERASLPPQVTDIIVRRGDRDVARIVARNAGAVFSDDGYSGLIRRAADDGMLALALGQREDITPQALKELLGTTVDIVRRRLYADAGPRQRAAISQAMNEISAPAYATRTPRDFAPARRAVLALHRAGQLNEAAIFRFARGHKYEEAVAGLATLSGIRIATIDRLIMGERSDPVLMLGRAIGLQWSSVRALLVLKLGAGKAPSPADIEEARLNFERLSVNTASRVLAFWRAREGGGSETD